MAHIQVVEGDNEYQAIVEGENMPAEEADRRVTTFFAHKEHGGKPIPLKKMDKHGKEIKEGGGE